MGGTSPEHRVELDFEITFRNGGGLQGQGFRLDIPGNDITDQDAGALLVRQPGCSWWTTCVSRRGASSRSLIGDARGRAWTMRAPIGW